MHRPEVYSLRNNLQVDTPVQTLLSPNVYFMNTLTVLQINPHTFLPLNPLTSLLPCFLSFKLETKARSLYVLQAKYPAPKPSNPPLISNILVVFYTNRTVQLISLNLISFAQ